MSGRKRVARVLLWGGWAISETACFACLIGFTWFAPVVLAGVAVMGLAAVTGMYGR